MNKSNFKREKLYLEQRKIFQESNFSFVANSNFLIPISFKPDGENLILNN